MTRRSASVSAHTSPPDSRVLIAHVPPQALSERDEGSQGCFLHLKNPKTGTKTCYLMMGESIQELHWFKQQYSSWFLGNNVIEDGSLYLCSPVDPIFLLFPILDEVRMKREDDLGKFRSLEEILFVEGYPGYSHLKPLLQHSLDAVCEVRDFGASNFYRLDDSKALAWLCCKVKLTLEGLDLLGGYESMLEERRMAHAVGLVGEYIKETPWLDRLCCHLGVDLQASRKSLAMDTSETLSFCASVSTVVKKEEKLSVGKSKVIKKCSTVGLRKMTQFFVLER